MSDSIEVVETQALARIEDNGGALVMPAGMARQIGIQMSRRQWALSAHAAITAQRSHHSRRAYDRALREFTVWAFGCSGHPASPSQFWAWFLSGSSAVVITKQVIIQYVREVLEARLSPVSVGMHCAAIRRALREGADAEWFDPTDRERLEAAARFPSPKVDQSRAAGRRLTREEVARILLAISRRAETVGTLQAAQDEAIAYLLSLAGLRRSEVAALTWADIQIDEGRPVLKVRGKGSKTRLVAIPPALGRALDRCRAALLADGGNQDGSLFYRINRHGQRATLPLLASGIESSLDRSLSLIGEDVKGINPHDLRRTFARAARMAGVSLDELREALGHASISTTDRYSRFGQDLARGRAVGDRVASYWAL